MQPTEHAYIILSRQDMIDTFFFLNFGISKYLKCWTNLNKFYKVGV